MSTELTATEAEWQRLDPKMLLVHPIREVFRFLPVLAGVFIAGSQAGGEGPPYELIGIAVPVLLGLARYWTTRYRIADGRIELRRGLVNKHVLTAQLDRVRTVDLTASPIHRVLSLTTMKIGTGTASTSGEDQLDLDGLPIARAHQLRYDLLHAVGSTRPGNGHEELAQEASSPALVARTVAMLDPAWARFAPLTSSGLVMFAAIAGVGSQLLGDVGFFESGHEIPGIEAALWVVVILIIVLGLITVSTLAVVGYLITNWDYSLTHTSTDGSWHLRRGLFTTRETSIDDGRVRGVAISEPVGLRLLGGARLSAVATGLGRREDGNTLLVPPAPRDVVDRVAMEVIGTAAPVEAPLVPHGPAAVRRRWTRALVLPLLATVVLVGTVVLADVPAWILVAPVAGLVVGAALARDRAQALGHALVDGFLVVRSGSLVRSREVLELDGIIGWNLRSSFFQRRAGLTTLVATTAGGSQSYAALDVPEERAVEVAMSAHPELLAQFLTDYRTQP